MFLEIVEDKKVFAHVKKKLVRILLTYLLDQILLRNCHCEMLLPLPCSPLSVILCYSLVLCQLIRHLWKSRGVLKRFGYFHDFAKKKYFSSEYFRVEKKCVGKKLLILEGITNYRAFHMFFWLGRIGRKI